MLCFSPKFGTPFAEQWYFKNVDKRKQNYRDKGVWGCVGLLPGDLMIMCGSFQKHMVHKTLPFSRITRFIIEDFPAINPRLKKSLEELIVKKGDFGKRKRVELEFKRTGRCCVASSHE